MSQTRLLRSSLRSSMFVAAASVAIATPWVAQARSFNFRADDSRAGDRASSLRITHALGQAWADPLLQIPGVVTDVPQARTLSAGLATAATWVAPNSGTFSTAANWTPAVVPDAASPLTFPASGTQSYTAVSDVATAFGNVTVANTGTGNVSLSGTVNGSSLISDSGLVTLSGGTHTFTSVSRGNDPVGSTNDGGFWSVAVGNTAAPANITINNGALVNYQNFFGANAPGSSSTVNISGTNTRVIGTTAQGRFGLNAGTGTINITNGAFVQARLYEFGRQSTATNTTVNVIGSTLRGLGGTDGLSAQVILPRGGVGGGGTNAVATLNIGAGGVFEMGGDLTPFSETGGPLNTMIMSGDLDTSGTLNVRDGGILRTLDAANASPGGRIFGATDSGGTANINVTNGGKIFNRLFFTGENLGDNNFPNRTTVVVSGTGSEFINRDFVFTQGAGAAPGFGRTELTVEAGGRFTAGIMETNENGSFSPAVPGPTVNSAFAMTLRGANSIVESTGFAQADDPTTPANEGIDFSYIIFGGGVNSTDQITISDGATLKATALVTPGITQRATYLRFGAVVASSVTLTASGENTRLLSDGNFIVSDYGTSNLTFGSGATVTSPFMITATGRVDRITTGISPAAQLLLPPDGTPSVANITVNSGATINITRDLETSGGVEQGGDTGDLGDGGGNTTINVNAGGTFNTGLLFANGDPFTDPTWTAGTTTINVSGATARFNVVGDPIPIPPSGTSPGAPNGRAGAVFLGAAAGGGAADQRSVVNVNVTNGGLFDITDGNTVTARDGFLSIGSSNAVTATVNVDGAGSRLDAGVELSLAAGTVNDVTATLNVTNGGAVTVNADVQNRFGGVFAGTAAGVGGSRNINITGSGSSLTAEGVMYLGGSVTDPDNNPATPPVFTIGKPSNLTAGAGTTVAIDSDFDGDGILVFGGSTMTTGGLVNVGNFGDNADNGTTIFDPFTGIDGTLTITGGRFFAGFFGVDATGTLEGVVRLTPTGGPAAVLVVRNLYAGTGVARGPVLTGGATLDIGRNAVVVDVTGATGPTTLAEARTLILAGRNNGTWNGLDGISSAWVAADPEARGIGYRLAGGDGPVTNFLGVTTTADDILIRATLLGDTDLSGTVNFPDLVALARSYNILSGRQWTEGDFTYDGAVNFPDLVALARNYNLALSADQIDVLGSDFAGDFALALSLVPEPATLTVLGIGAAALLTRHRRSRR